MIDRRGLSAVVTTTLLVLGAVIGVAFLWSFVLKNTDKTSEIDDESCLTINLEPISCQAYGTCNYQVGGSYHEADIVVKRNVGKGNVTGIRYVFEGQDGRKGTYDREVTSWDEFESLKVVEPYGIPVLGGNPNLLRVVAMVGKNKDACSIISKKIRCFERTPIQSLGIYANNTPGYTDSPASSSRAGNCCQWPVNTSECYDGSHPDYPVDSTGKLINGLPFGYKTTCCAKQPY